MCEFALHFTIKNFQTVENAVEDSVEESFADAVEDTVGEAFGEAVTSTWKKQLLYFIAGKKEQWTYNIQLSRISRNVLNVCANGADKS